VVRPGAVARAGWILIAVLAVAISARLSVPVPGTDVPQSLQTLAVLVVAAWLGAVDGGVALVAYVLMGASGLPVYSDGGSGWGHLLGSTGGYLVGFVVAGVAVGAAADRGLLRRAGWALAAMLGGHLVILTLGWAWLSTSVGAAAAFQGGVVPFLWGGVVKSVVGAAAVVLIVRRRVSAR